MHASRGWIVLAVLVSPLLAEERYLLKGPAADLGLSLRGTTVSKGGVAETHDAAGDHASRVELTRERIWQRLYLADGPRGKVSYRIIKDRISTGLDGAGESHDGPLSGHVAVGEKNGAGNWVFELGDDVPDAEQRRELELLGLFENRRWLPGEEVALGESWKFTPGFLRGTLRRDLPHAEMIGLMTLRKVETNARGERQAVIDCVIRGGGEEHDAAGGEHDAEALLSGNLTVNLERSGEMSFHLTGALVTGAREGGVVSRVRMPVTMKLEMSPLGGALIGP